MTQMTISNKWGTISLSRPERANRKVKSGKSGDQLREGRKGKLILKVDKKTSSSDDGSLSD